MASWNRLGSTQVEGTQDQGQLHFLGIPRPCIYWSDWSAAEYTAGGADTSERGARNHGSDLDPKNPKNHHPAGDLLAMVYELK